MPVPLRGKVWLIDFGMTGKTRPALVTSEAFGDRDRAPITVIPHTTSLRGSPFEIMRFWYRALLRFRPSSVLPARHRAA
jgi:hypothetical protein